MGDAALQLATARAGRASWFRHGLFLAAFALYLTAGYFGTIRFGLISTEGIVRTGVVCDILRGDDMGRQGLVCSLVYPPLPTLAVAAVAVFPSFLRNCFAATIVSAFFGALAVALFDLVCETLIRRRTIRAILVALFLLLPAMICQSTQGTSGTMLVAFALGNCYLVMQWTRTRELKHFLGFATLSGLSLMVSPAGIALGLAAVAAIAVTVGLRVTDRAERRGLWWALAFPPVYVIATWIGLNWVIMEDPLFAFRVLWRANLRDAASGAFSGAPMEVAATSSAMIFLVLALIILAAGGLGLRMPRGTQEAPGRPRTALFRLSFGLLAGMALVAAWSLPFAGIVGLSASSSSSSGVQSVAQSWLPPDPVAGDSAVTELRTKLDELLPKGRIVADGFYSYPLVYRGAAEGRLITTLDFSGQTLRGLRGPFFLLVPSPVGRLAAEDVLVKFPGIYSHEVPITDYYVDRIGSWRVYKLMDRW